MVRERPMQVPPDPVPPLHVMASQSRTRQPSATTKSGRNMKESNVSTTTTATELHDFGDKDYEPCADCGTPLYLADPCCAVDGAVACIPCGRSRYGEHLGQYVIVGEESPDR